MKKILLILAILLMPIIIQAQYITCNHGEMCQVYGWVYDISGEDIYDVMVIADDTLLQHSDTAITDSTGYWQLDLIPNYEYRFIIKYNSGVTFRAEAVVSDMVKWRLR